MNTEFKLKPEHITLLSNADWFWDDDVGVGGPSVDSTRSFGNSVGIARDIAKIIRPDDEELLSILEGDDAERINEAEQELVKIWRECLTALEVIIGSNALPFVRYKKVKGAWEQHDDETK